MGLLVIPMSSFQPVAKVINDTKQENINSCNISYSIVGIVHRKGCQLLVLDGVAVEIKLLSKYDETNEWGFYSFDLKEEDLGEITITARLYGYYQVDIHLSLTKDDFKNGISYELNIGMQKSKSRSLFLNRFPVLFQLMENILKI